MQTAAPHIVVLTVLAFAAPASGQQDLPTFRSGVHVVEVDVRVFDDDGNFVTDLAREEFELVENGEPQEIQQVFFVSGGAPARSGGTASQAEPSSAAASAAPAASARQTWIFVFDLNHLTPGGGFDRARTAVEQFIRERFSEGDLAGVVAGSRMVNNRLTTVREELMAAVKSVKPLPDSRSRQIELTREWPRFQNEQEAFLVASENRDALQRAVMRACSDDPSACGMVPPDLEIRQKARRLVTEMHRATTETLTAMNALATGLAKMPGSKTIVFLSDGFVAQELETTLRTVVGQAARAGARVYAIDVRGLNRGGGAGILDQAQVNDEAGAFAQFDAVEDGPNSLAVDTGGLMIRNENNIGRALDTIAADAGRFYVVAYQPANTNFDGKYRPIEVRVKRPGVRVRARKGYLALEPSKMLVPQPVRTASPAAGRIEANAPVRGADAAPAAEPLPAAAAGSVVTSEPVAPPDAVRLGPDAKNRVEALSAGNTRDAGALAQKGWEAYQRGDVEAAIGPLSEAGSDPNARPWVLYALGFSQVALGRRAEAIASWERVREATPEFEPVYIDLADTYVHLSDTTRALEVLREAEKRFPASDEVHNAIGVIHVRRGALDDAIEAFQRAVAAAPSEALGYLNLARAYELRYHRARRWVDSQRRWVAPEQDRVKAREAYERCIRLGGPYSVQASEALSRLEWTH